MSTGVDLWKGGCSSSAQPRTYWPCHAILLLIYVGVYGWLLATTGFMPYVMDNNESFSVLWHSSNLHAFSFWKSFGLTDESFSPAAAAHPFFHTHQGNMPRLFGFLIYLLGARSIESQIIVTTAVIGTFAVFVIYEYLACLAGYVFSCICTSLLITNYVLFTQWHICTYRVWYALLFFGILLSLERFQGPHARRWRLLLRLLYGLLFYFELVFAGFVTVLSVSYAGVRYRRDFPAFRKVLWVVASSAVFALGLLFTQITLAFGPSVAFKDLQITFFSRNHSGALQVQSLQKFFEAHNIAFWYNILDVTSYRNLQSLIWSQTHFDFQIYTPILTAATFVLVGAWLIAVVSDACRTGSERFLRRQMYTALTCCWAIAGVAAAPALLGAWLRFGGGVFSVPAALGFGAVGFTMAMVVRYGPASLFRLMNLTAAEPECCRAPVRMTSLICVAAMLLSLQAVLARKADPSPSSLLLLTGFRVAYIAATIALSLIGIWPGLVRFLGRAAGFCKSSLGILDQAPAFSRSLLVTVLFLPLALIPLKTAIGPSLHIWPWVTLYWIFFATFALGVLAWQSLLRVGRACGRPIGRIGRLAAAELAASGPAAAVRASALMIVAVLAPFGLMLLDARVAGGLFFESYTLPYFLFLCAYFGICIGLLRCCFHAALPLIWLERIRSACALAAGGDPAASRSSRRIAEIWDSQGSVRDLRFCNFLKWVSLILMWYYTARSVFTGGEVFGMPVDGRASALGLAVQLPLILLALAATMMTIRAAGPHWLDCRQLGTGACLRLLILLLLAGTFIHKQSFLYEQTYAVLFVHAFSGEIATRAAQAGIFLAIWVAALIVIAGAREICGTREVGNVLIFFALGEAAYSLIYWLSPGYVLTGYQWRQAPFSVFVTCAAPALALFLSCRVAAWVWRGRRSDGAAHGAGDAAGFLSPGFKTIMGVAAALAPALGCLCWVSIQAMYLQLLPPDHYSFLKQLRKPPYHGKSFVVNNYPAPVAAMTGSWAYDDPMISTGWRQTANGYALARDDRYLWFADRRSNRSYRTPDYFICMVGQDLSTAAEQLRSGGKGVAPTGCGSEGLVAAAAAGKISVTDYALVDRDRNRSDSWAIVKLAYRYRPYLQQLGPGSRDGVLLTVARSDPDAPLQAAIEYGYGSVSQQAETDSALELYAAPGASCAVGTPDWTLLYHGPVKRQLLLPERFSGLIRASVTPRSAEGSGWTYGSQVLRIEDGNAATVEVCGMPPKPLSPSGLHVFRLDDVTFALEWRRAPRAQVYMIESGRESEPLETIGQTDAQRLQYIAQVEDPTGRHGFRVRACGVAGGCSWATPIAYEERFFDLHPEPISDLLATRISGDSAYIEWQPAAYADSYRVEINSKHGAPEEILRTDPGAVREWARNLQPDTEYDVRVQACRGNECSPYSQAAPISGHRGGFVPAGFSAMRVMPTAVRLAWNSSEGQRYEIEMASGTGTYEKMGYIIGQGEYTVSDLSAKTSYRFRIRACLGSPGPCSEYTPEAAVGPAR